MTKQALYALLIVGLHATAIWANGGMWQRLAAEDQSNDCDDKSKYCYAGMQLLASALLGYLLGRFLRG